jgi:hypothetical protein
MQRQWATVEHGLAALYPRHAAAMGRSLRAMVSAHVAQRPADCSSATWPEKPTRLVPECPPEWATSATPTCSRTPGRCHRAAAVPGGTGRHVPAPDAAAQAARRRERRRLRGGRVRRGEPPPGHDGPARDAGRRVARTRHEPVHRPRAEPHRRRAPVGAAGARRPPRLTATSTCSSPTARCPTVRAHAAGGLPHVRAGQLHLAARPGEQWVWTTFHEFQWDLNWASPHVFRGDVRGDAPPQPIKASTCCASTRRRSCGSAKARSARTSRKCTCCSPRCGR